MAIFHLSVSLVQRSKGQSAVARASYIEDRTMKDDRQGKVFRYGSDQTRKHETTVCLGSRLPDGSAIDTAELWNLAEARETRKNAQIARSIDAALPIECDQDIHKKIVDAFRRHLEKRYGVATTAVIHYEHDHNPHTHILFTTREVEGRTLTEKTRDLDRRKATRPDETTGSQEIESIRAEWAKICNEYLKDEKKIDHRSYAKRGIKLSPGIHVGITGMRMHRTGSISARWRWNDQRNRLRLAEARAHIAKKRIEDARRSYENVDRDPRGETQNRGLGKQLDSTEKRDQGVPGQDREYIGSAAGRRAAGGQRSRQQDQGRDRDHVGLDTRDRQGSADHEQRYEEKRPQNDTYLSIKIEWIETKIKAYQDQIDLQKIGENDGQREHQYHRQHRD